MRKEIYSGWNIHKLKEFPLVGGSGWRHAFVGAELTKVLLKVHTSDWEWDLKLQRQSWRWYNSSLAITLAVEFSYCSQANSPGCYTCRGKLCWRAVKAGDGSYSPGKLLFAGVVNWILLLTLAGEFSNRLLLVIGAYINKKWQIITFSYEKVKIHYYFVLNSEKSLLFRKEKWQIFTYS